MKDEMLRRFGQTGQPAAPRGNRGQDQGLNAIQQALNLTEAQMVSLKALLDQRRETVKAIGQEAMPKAEALRNLMSQANPDPTAVGNAMLALRAVQEKIKATETKFQDDFANLLTSDQKQTYETLKNTDGGRGLRRFGLLGPGSSGRRPFGMPFGGRGFRKRNQ